MKSTVLAIPDIHAPFEHKNAFRFLKDVKDKYKPTRIVCLGDELDHCSISRYTPNPDGMNPGKELNEGVQHLKKLYEIFPDVDVCISNHGIRPFKKAFEAGIPSVLIKSYREFSEAPKGWKWHSRVVIDGVQYIHGDAFSGQNAHVTSATKHRQSTVIGHVHSFAGIQYMNGNAGQIFGMNCGCLIDEKAYAFNYAKAMPNKPTLGCGIIKDGREGIFIPLT